MPTLLVAQLDRFAWWLMPRDAPPTFPFARWPDVALVNPLAVRSLVDLTGDQRLTYFGGPEGVEDPLVVCTNVICFIMSADWEETHHDSELVLRVFHEQVPEMLRQLRWAARSPTFPTSHGGGSACALRREPTVVLPDSADGAAVMDMDRAWLVSQEAIQQAATCPEGWAPPVYGWLLLDAILAWMGLDYKKSVVLAAVAAETMAEMTLKLECDRLLTQDRSNPRMRFVEQHTSDHGAAWLDPVYLALTAGQSARKMRRLLHEGALYVLGRSLMLEDPSLFEQIIKLYGARNRILHSGGTEYDTGGFFAHHRNVENTLRAVIALNRWLGGPTGFSLVETPLFLQKWPRE